MKDEDPKITPKPAAPAFDLDLPPPSLSLPHRKKSRKLLWLLLIPAIILVLALISIFSAFAWYNNALQPRSTGEAATPVKVESGATVEQVGAELEQKAIIKSGLAFSLYMKLNNKTVKTGTYFFAPGQSVSEIATWLNDGRVGTRKVTILPGKTLVQIRKGLIDDGFTAQDVDAALAKKYVHPLLAEKPEAANLEGYIYPETYYVTTDSTADQLLVRTFDEFQKQIEAIGLRQKLAARGFNLYQGITLASIVTREVTNTDDQHQVAQVFELRLATGMVLGSDVTYHYAASLLGVAPSADINSPYNTHKYPGLPPGPIANFNLTALQAVAEPSPGTYLYFVAGDDGTTHYAKTFEEHQQNVSKYCQKLCASE
jgi:UPF0755 protein